MLRRNCLLKHVIEGKLEDRSEMTGIRGRRFKQLVDDVKEKRKYWKLKVEALDRTVWRTRFGWGYGSVVRDNRLNECCCISSLSFILSLSCRLLVGYLFVTICSTTVYTLFILSLTCVCIHIYIYTIQFDMIV